MPEGDFIIDLPILGTSPSDAVIEVQQVSKPTQTEQVTKANFLKEVNTIIASHIADVNNPHNTPVGSGSAQRIDDNSGGMYGVLTGVTNGVNKLFTVSANSYTAGKLKVWWQGQLQSGIMVTQTSPATGVFSLSVAPSAGQIVTAEYLP